MEIKGKKLVHVGGTCSLDLDEKRHKHNVIRHLRCSLRLNPKFINQKTSFVRPANTTCLVL
jgi:hypothetical protein